MANIDLSTLYKIFILIFFNARIVFGFLRVYKPNLKKDFMPNIVAIGFFLFYSAFLNTAIYQFEGFLSANINNIFSLFVSFIVLELGFRLTKYLVSKKISSKEMSSKFNYFCEVFIYPSGSVILFVLIILGLINFF